MSSDFSINFGILNGQNQSQIDSENGDKTVVKPNVEEASIFPLEDLGNHDEEYKEMIKSPNTFPDIFSMIHDAYGFDFNDQEYLQILYQVVKDPANSEVFKDLLGKKDFQDAYDSGNLQYLVGFINGLTDELDGITLPDVEIQS